MKFTVAAALFAAGVSAYAHNNVTIVTEVVSEYTTYCPGPTEITHGGSTYTVTEATTLTITDCPCTITKPVTTLTSVVCHTCSEAPIPTVVVPTSAPVVPTPIVPTHGYNSTIVTVPTVPGTGVPPAATSAPPAELPSSAGKTVLSAGLLAGLVGLAAFL